MRCKRPVHTLPIKLAFALLPLAALSACATPADDTYPSLAIRDAERVNGTAEPVAREPYVPPATPAGVLDRLAQLRATAVQAHATFTSRAQASRGTISNGIRAAEGSDAWAAASAALADLEGARSQAMLPLADLDRLYVDAATGGEELARIAAVRDEVVALVAEEDATIDRLTGPR